MVSRSVVTESATANSPALESSCDCHPFRITQARESNGDSSERSTRFAGRQASIGTQETFTPVEIDLEVGYPTRAKPWNGRHWYETSLTLRHSESRAWPGRVNGTAGSNGHSY